MKKLFITFLLACCLSIQSTAQSFDTTPSIGNGMNISANGFAKWEGYRYPIDFVIVDGKVTITQYKANYSSFSIYPTIGGFPVTDIGSLAFYNSSLTNIVIPNNITDIRVQAFRSVYLQLQLQ